MQIADGVHQITLGGEAEGGGPSTYIYYIEGRYTGAFIDAGFPDEPRTRPLMKYWRKELNRLRTSVILITHRHFEHAGGAKLMRELTGARVAAGQGDTDAINSQFGGGTPVVDLPLKGEEVFEMGQRRIRAIATPGHTGGTTCYLLEPDGIIFTGDHIMGQGTVVVRTDEGGTMSDHVESLRKLQTLNIQVIRSGHGPAIQDPQAKLQELVRHRVERELEILNLLRQGVGEVDALVARIYRDAPERLIRLARHQVLAHLHKLGAEGSVVAEVAGKSFRVL